MDEDYKNMCGVCRNRNHCKAPCSFVEEILREGNKPPFYEKNMRSENGKDALQIKSKNYRHEVNATNLAQDKKILSGDNKKSDPFNTDALSPFTDLKPSLGQTVVFVNRFFLRKSYEDIAEELNISVDTSVSMFRHAKDRMLEALKLSDERFSTIHRYESLLKRNDKSFGILPKGQRLFIMNRVLGLTVPEISEMENMPVNQVNHRIKEVSDRLKIGPIEWIECSDEDRAAAQENIIKKRQRQSKWQNKITKAAA